jgi:hypothetical protein
MHINFKKYKLVESNVYDIPQRLKAIDPGYFVLLNRYTGKFEIHSSNHPTLTYCMTVPFEGLDGRAIELVEKTRRQDNDQMIREMDAHNEKLEKDRDAKFSDTIGEMTKDLYNYGKKTVRESRIDSKGVMF